MYARPHRNARLFYALTALLLLCFFACGGEAPQGEPKPIPRSGKMFMGRYRADLNPFNSTVEIAREELPESDKLAIQARYGWSNSLIWNAYIAEPDSASCGTPNWNPATLTLTFDALIHNRSNQLQVSDPNY